MNIVEEQQKLLSEIDFPNKYDNSLLPIENFPALVIDIDESVPGDTDSGLTVISGILDFVVIDLVDNYSSISEARQYVTAKMIEVLNSEATARCRITENITHFETVIEGQKASIVMCKVEVL